EYAAAKRRILSGAGRQVLNRDDARSLAMALPGARTSTFGLDRPPGAEDFGVVDGALSRGAQPLIGASELRIRGSHNVANALAACALAGELAPAQALAEGLRSFE